MERESKRDYGKNRGFDDARIFLIIRGGNVIHRLVWDSLVEVLMDWSIWRRDCLFFFVKRDRQEGKSRLWGG